MGLISFPLFLTTGHDQRATGLGMIATRTQISVVCQLQGSTMIWKVPEMISYLSGLFTLRPGDIILSGTPAGVGAVDRGDVLNGHIDGVGDLEVRVV